MLKIGQLNFLHYVCRECDLYSKLYRQMTRIVGIRRAIYFRLNLSAYYKMQDYDLIFLAIVMIELQNPRLQHKYKDDYYFHVQEIFRSLSSHYRDTVEQHFKTIIFGRN
jgi:hypothetical protein